MMFQQSVSLLNRKTITGRIKKVGCSNFACQNFFLTCFYEATDHLHLITDIKVNMWQGKCIDDLIVSTTIRSMPVS